MSDTFPIAGGVFLGSVVAFIDAGTALALVVFLLRRWPRLNATLRAYTIFWGLTMTTWLPLGFRYLFLSLGSTSPWLNTLDLGVQTSVFFSGPLLLYYVLTRIQKSNLLIMAFVVFSFFLATISVWIMSQPGGLIQQPPTYFSVETTPSAIPMYIFNIEAGLIFLLLCYDVYLKFRQYRRRRLGTPYEIFYSLAIIVYLLLGSIDQAGFVTNWILIALRACYAGVFLFVYITISQHQASVESYLEMPTDRIQSQSG